MAGSHSRQKTKEALAAEQRKRFSFFEPLLLHDKKTLLKALSDFKKAGTAYRPAGVAPAVMMNERTKYGLSLLQVAAREGMIPQVVFSLLQQGALLDEPLDSKKEPFQSADIISVVENAKKSSYQFAKERGHKLLADALAVISAPHADVPVDINIRNAVLFWFIENNLSESQFNFLRNFKKAPEQKKLPRQKKHDAGHIKSSVALERKVSEKSALKLSPEVIACSTYNRLLEFIAYRNDAALAKTFLPLGELKENRSIATPAFWSAMSQSGVLYRTIYPTENCSQSLALMLTQLREGGFTEILEKELNRLPGDRPSKELYSTKNYGSPQVPDHLTVKQKRVYSSALFGKEKDLRSFSPTPEDYYTCLATALQEEHFVAFAVLKKQWTIAPSTILKIALEKGNYHFVRFWVIVTNTDILEMAEILLSEKNDKSVGDKKDEKAGVPRKEKAKQTSLEKFIHYCTSIEGLLYQLMVVPTLSEDQLKLFVWLKHQYELSGEENIGKLFVQHGSDHHPHQDFHQIMEEKEVSARSSALKFLRSQYQRFNLPWSLMLDDSPVFNKRLCPDPSKPVSLGNLPKNVYQTIDSFCGKEGVIVTGDKLRKWSSEKSTAFALTSRKIRNSLGYKQNEPSELSGKKAEDKLTAAEEKLAPGKAADAKHREYIAELSALSAAGEQQKAQMPKFVLMSLHVRPNIPDAGSQDYGITIAEEGIGAQIHEQYPLVSKEQKMFLYHAEHAGRIINLDKQLLAVDDLDTALQNEIDAKNCCQDRICVCENECGEEVCYVCCCCDVFSEDARKYPLCCDDKKKQNDASFYWLLSGIPLLLAATGSISVYSGARLATNLAARSVLCEMFNNVTSSTPNFNGLSCNDLHMPQSIWCISATRCYDYVVSLVDPSTNKTHNQDYGISPECRPLCNQMIELEVPGVFEGFGTVLAALLFIIFLCYLKRLLGSLRGPERFQHFSLSAFPASKRKINQFLRGIEEHKQVQSALKSVTVATTVQEFRAGKKYIKQAIQMERSLLSARESKEAALLPVPNAAAGALDEKRSSPNAGRGALASVSIVGATSDEKRNSLLVDGGMFASVKASSAADMKENVRLLKPAAKVGLQMLGLNLFGVAKKEKSNRKMHFNPEKFFSSGVELSEDFSSQMSVVVDTGSAQPSEKRELSGAGAYQSLSS